ncbi:uncharacterized protein LOC144556719 [Carex rostrata]
MITAKGERGEQKGLHCQHKGTSSTRSSRKGGTSTRKPQQDWFQCRCQKQQKNPITWKISTSTSTDTSTVITAKTQKVRPVVRRGKRENKKGLHCEYKSTASTTSSKQVVTITQPVQETHNRAGTSIGTVKISTTSKQGK